MADFSPVQLINPPGAPYFSEFPRVVGIEVTGRCQLQCAHCFNRSGPQNTHELPLSVIERILDETVGWGVKEVRLSGGEPTVHREFRRIVEACATRNLAIALNTNGIYSSEMLTFLAAAPINLFLVSVDGLEERNDTVRGPETFRRATASARALIKAGRKVMLSCHLFLGNAGDVAGLVALAAEIDADIKFSPVRPVGRALEKLPGTTLDARTYLDVVREITEMRRMFPGISILTDFDVLDDSRSDVCVRDGNSASCRAGRTMVNINYDGEIYPCAFFATPEREFSAGSVYDGCVTDAWQNAPVFTPFRQHQKSDTCRNCGFYQRRCSGGCPAVSHFATGHLDALDPTCFASRIDSTSRHRSP